MLLRCDPQADRREAGGDLARRKEDARELEPPRPAPVLREGLDLGEADSRREKVLQGQGVHPRGAPAHLHRRRRPLPVGQRDHALPRRGQERRAAQAQGEGDGEGADPDRAGARATREAAGRALGRARRAQRRLREGEREADCPRHRGRRHGQAPRSRVQAHRRPDGRAHALGVGCCGAEREEDSACGRLPPRRLLPFVRRRVLEQVPR
mmetsp:Transcript_8542/g.18123  ORF Transcript_8542/g.18123 Transcript_8542/m.18123 type:complete len:209 (-) Transcript_8542:371-997(-)